MWATDRGEWSTVSPADILDDLAARGLIHDSTDPVALRERLAGGPIGVYAGFDPTADSLHVGNLVPLLLLRRFQQFGHRPVAVAGGATGMIGDPGGRATERVLLDAATLDTNLTAITEQLRRLLDFSEGPASARLVDNRDWTAPIGVLEFLRDVGKHITVNTMLAKDSVRSRVESDAGISFTEFSYMLLQANDFRHLHEHLQVELQVGGSDQWGNITAGIDLIRRTSGAHVHGLTVPLVTQADGSKFGKSVDGAVWLSAERTTPYAFYQYFVNTDDRDVERFLLQLTLLPVEQIAAIMGEHSAAPERRSAQQELARSVTALVHGQAEADRAAGASAGFTRTAVELTEGDWAELAASLPVTELVSSDIGRDIVDLLAASGIVASKGEGRRLVSQRGLSLNDVPITEGQQLCADDLLAGGWSMIRRGRKQRFLLHLAR
ncbi:MAG: tyrosine--tRNA ligase [Actinobacteria bacterium]|nr:tyrosine--tRNA ligase [Actinomycetota bacterium]